MALKLKPLTQHVYCLSDSLDRKKPLLVCIAGDDQLLMIDGGASIHHMEAMLAEIEQDNTLNSLSKLGVVSDCHWNHVFGLQVCHFPYIAHKQAKDTLEKMAAWDWSDEMLERYIKEDKLLPSEVKEIKREMPDRSDLHIQVPCIMYRHQLELDLGNLSCLLEHIESDHSPDSTVVYLKEDKVLVVGDCMNFGMHYTTPSYSRQLFHVIDMLLAYDAEYFVFSSENKVLDRNEFIEHCEYLKLLGATVSQHYDDFEAIENELGSIKKEDIKYIHAFIEGLKRGKGIL